MACSTLFRRVYSASDGILAGATSSVSCSLCQAGTYWTGSGSNHVEERVRLCVWDGAVAKICFPPVRLAWLVPVCVSIILVRAACPETPCCLQGPLLQAIAASARPEPTRLSQVWSGLPHRSLQPRFQTAPIDVRLRGGACALVICAETPCAQEALLPACAACVSPGLTPAAQVRLLLT